MRRINIFLDKNDVERLSVAIARLESLHLRSDNGEEWSEESPKWGGLLDTYLGYKRRIDRLHAILQSPTAPEEAFVEPHPSLHAEQLDDAIGEIESEVLAWKKEADKIDSEIEQVELLRREVSALRPLGVPLEELRNPTHVDWTVGTIPTENLGRLETLLFRVPVVVLSLGRSGDRTLVLIASAVEGSSRSERDGTGEPAVRERLRTHLYQRERLRRVYQSLDLEQPDRTVYAPPEETSGEERVSSSIERIENEISEWQEELQRNLSRIESVERTLVRVRRLEPLDVPFEKLREREHLTWEVGTMPEEAMERFRRSPASLDIVLLPLESEGEERLVAAVSTTQEDGTLRRMMEGVGLAPLELPDEIERVPADVADSLQRQVEEAR
ncbi:hypothetical protein, partial [Salinispira pacifica]